MMYVVRDREAGNVIDTFESVKEAEAALRQYEDYGLLEGIYEPDFYEVAEKED